MKKLYAEIAQDLSGEVEESELISVLSHLESYTVTEPGPEKTQNLLSHLQSCLALERPVGKDYLFDEEKWYLAAFHMAKDQFRLARLWFWVLMAGLTILGALIAPAEYSIHPVIPMLALGVVLGISHLFRFDTEGYLEMEAACPISIEQLASARLLIISLAQIAIFSLLLVVNRLFVYNILPKLNLSILSILIPLAFFGAITLLLCIWFGNIAGVVGGSVVWGLMFSFNRYVDIKDIWSVFSNGYMTQIIYISMTCLLFYWIFFNPKTKRGYQQ